MLTAKVTRVFIPLHWIAICSAWIGHSDRTGVVIDRSAVVANCLPLFELLFAAQRAPSSIGIRSWPLFLNWEPRTPLWADDAQSGNNVTVSLRVGFGTKQRRE